MERFILKKLLAWKNSPYRKPLILKGVRQVGKTWILKEFGRRCYENTAYFNFDENEEYKQFFETTKDVDRILQNLIVKAKLFCPEIAGLFCRIAGLFCHDSRANLSLKPVCFGIAIS